MCGKKVEDILKHYVLAHDIENPVHFKELLEEKEKDEKKRFEFSKYIEDLINKIEKGEISAEDYRKLVTKWQIDHR